MKLPEKEIIELMRESVNKGIPFTFKALGGSMFPFIPNGAYVTVEKFKKYPPSPGTICLAVKDDKLYCHRLLKICNKTNDGIYFILKGDNHRFSDNPFSPQDVIGRITKIKYGPVEINMEFPLITIAGILWMKSPWQIIAIVRVFWKASRPLRKILKSIFHLLNFSRHWNEND